ncbi:MAG TPA: hypothetical protein PKD85_13955, partial [Saprospiraceae bacterium]|nr:hypothetical protein [Saprospiraceae bacterium]
MAKRNNCMWYQMKIIKNLLIFTLISFQLNAQSSFKSSSILAEGQVFKFSISESGVYKLTKSVLDRAGVPTNVNPLNIKVYTFPGGHLEERIIPTSIVNDLYEIPVEVIGGSDGRFDANDEIYFYAEGPSVWRYDSIAQTWSFNNNIYDTKAYIYVKVDQTPSKKIIESPGNITPEITSNRYELKQNFEVDKLNILTLNINTQGSGQQWFGDNFKALENQAIPSIDLTKYLPNENITVQALFATRSATSSTVELSIGSERFSRNTSGVFLNSIETNFASLASFDLQTRPTTLSQGIRIALRNTSSTADAWVDYVRTIGYTQSNYNGEQLFVSDRSLINK